jgi:multidrug efflux pump
MHTGRAIVFLRDWRERDATTNDVIQQLRGDFNQLPGVRVNAQARGGLVRSRGQSFQVVLGGPDYAELAEWRDRVMARIEAYPGLFGADSDYKETRPQLRIEIDRVRAADLGVPVQAIGRTLETMMGARRVTTYVEDGEEYDVLLQAERANRSSTADLDNLYVRSTTGAGLVPLANLVTFAEVAEPGTYNRFNRLRAITISANVTPGYTLGDTLDWVRQVADEELPDYAQLDFKGESREYQSAGGAAVMTLGLALMIVYLVLAAQFESFIHPLVIMVTVPFAFVGALLGLWLAYLGSTMGWWEAIGSLNLFSQIGIVMLVGLAAKNGILIVEFANQLRDEGMAVRDAVLESAAVRLRPILMTSVATIAGAIPLVLAGGPGSASRATIGVVVVAGVAFSTLLSLYVVPAFYALLAPYTSSPGAVARTLAKLEDDIPPVGGHA